jgi:hypothetical protein
MYFLWIRNMFGEVELFISPGAVAMSLNGKERQNIVCP